MKRNLPPPLDSGAWLIARLAPLRDPLPWRPREALRGATGALLGILITYAVCRQALGDDRALPLLVAPMGASAVLLFAVPASPLAQPWSVMGGNVVSALVGVTCARFVPDPTGAAAAAVGLAILAMSLCRCLHPPGGAVALTAVIGGPTVAAAGYGFALAPVGLNTLLLVGAALLFNNLSGHSYPHIAASPPVNTHGTADPPPQERIGFSAEDLDEALRRYGEVLDVSREDLQALFQQLEARAFRRLHREILCGEVMSRDVIAIEAEASVDEARRRLVERRLSALPVVDAEGHALGLVGHADLAGRDGIVAEAMDTAFMRCAVDTPIDDLLPSLSAGAHAALVLEDDERLVGVVTQTDVLAALYRAGAARAVAG
jgi:CBS domain-containing membrane protein